MIPQILGIIAFINSSISFSLKKKEKILIFQIIAQIFYSVSYLLLNALTGYAYATTNLLKLFIIAIKEKHKILNNNIPLFIFILIYSILGIYTYQDIYSLCAITAAIIYTSMLWQGNVKEIKIAGLINCTLWCIYDFHFLAYAQCIGDIIVFIVITLSLIKENKNDTRKIEITSR